MIVNVIRWILSDLRVDSQLNLEDAELMRLGFSWTETQSMTMIQRQNHLSAGRIVGDFYRMSDRRSEIDVAILSSGFAEKKARKSITDRWDREASDNLDRLAQYSVESVGDIMKASKPAIRTKNFKERLLSVKDGKGKTDG